MSAGFQTGLDGLLARRGLPHGARIGVVAHAASLHAGGAHATGLLARAAGGRLRAIFTPEHGLSGAAGAGESVESSRDPDLGIPVFSLYGAHRRPSPDMLSTVDAIVFDLQDLGVRCYTYVSTLRAVIETAAGAGKTVIVADRPVPLPHTVDGPMLDPALESFVGCIPAPLVYGMTPGETARWLVQTLGLDLDLRVAPMRGWTPGTWPSGRGAPPWTPPSPGIRSWECARAYAATVFTEALPSLDCDRAGLIPFQVLGAPWMDADAVLRRLRRPVSGAALHRHRYTSRGVAMDGVRLAVTDPARFRPVSLAAALLAAISATHGPERLWAADGARPAFFDQLAGSSAFREGLHAGRTASALAAGWRSAARGFASARDNALLYRR